MQGTVMMKDVFTLPDRDGNPSEVKERWTRVGIAFVNRDNSLNVILDAFPTNGRLHIRDRKARSETKQTRDASSEGYRPREARAS